ncbi:hypothetical protein [Streptomyces sp. NPDC026659]|uniref:hypothetical protein n=1 Tax=Streptomyces sp. NPDC026659 TaxID=3155123 RepID=UPI003406044D
MGKVYKSPTAFRAALKQAAVNMSRTTGMSIAELMKIFYFNRLAARVFTKEPDGWLIKGGQALLVRYRVPPASVRTSTCRAPIPIAAPMTRGNW